MEWFLSVAVDLVGRSFDGGCSTLEMGAWVPEVFIAAAVGDNPRLTSFTFSVGSTAPVE